jgi:alpha-1,6-mannosyltransferase
MNDVAEKTLHALNVAQAAVRARPTTALSLTGFVTSAVVVVAGARAAAARTSGSVTPWFGLSTSRGQDHTAEVAGGIALGAIVVLLLLWGTALATVRRRRLPEIRVWTIAAAWAAPLALGPPLLDTHVLLDAARGLLQRNGVDPYVHPISSLGQTHLVNSVDASLRGVPSAAGPLATLVQHLAASAAGGHALPAVLLLRAVAVVSAVQIGRAALELAGRRRSRALVLTVLNPLVLLYIVSAAHLDGLALALLLTGLASADQRRWARAVLLVSLAGCVAPVLLVALPFVVTAHVIGRRGGYPGWVAGRDLVEMLVVIVVAHVAVEDGHGWVRTVSAQFSDYVVYSPANAVGRLLEPIVAGASFDDLVAGGRLAAIIAMSATVGYLLTTARWRPLDHSVGFALLAVALFAPDVHPWFLLWAVVCLGPTVTGLNRSVVMLLSATACLLDPVGFSTSTTDVLSVAAIGCGLVVLALTLRRSDETTDIAAVTGATADGVGPAGERGQRPPEISRTAGRTSAR